MGRQSNYSAGVFDQLQEVMERLSAMETQHRQDHSEIQYLNRVVDSQEKELILLRGTVREQKEALDSLYAENESLLKENRLLKDDNERMKRILNNDSSNSSLPPSSDQPGKAPDTYNGRKTSGRKKGGQPGHKTARPDRKTAEEHIRQGKLLHWVEEIGTPTGNYAVRHRPDLEVRKR